MIVPVLPARADLLGGLTDLVDVTVHETTDVVDEIADATTDAVDEVAGSTGRVLNDPVDDTTDLVDGVSDSVTTVVDETEETLIGVVDATEVPLTEVVDDDVDTDTGNTTRPSRGTTTTVAPSTDAVASNTPSHNTRAIDSDASSDRTTSNSRSEGLESFDALTVLSAAHGLSDSSVSELVDVASVTDASLYGRLLRWLTAAESGVFGLLAGPVLALEILLRALTSAGSGLVAPLSLLSAYLLGLMWQLHVRRP